MRTVYGCAPESEQTMNRYENPHGAGEAVIRYLDGDYQVVKPGGFVRCAVTSAIIPLEDLRYWSVERQEAYAGPEVAFQRYVETDGSDR